MNKLLFPLALLAASSAWSQTPRPNITDAATRQVQSARQRQFLTNQLNSSFSNGDNAPELYPGESADVGPQYLVIEKPRRRWFEFSADSQLYYTSNLLLSEKANIDTSVLLTTAQFAVAPDPFTLGNGQVQFRIGYRQQDYLYGLDRSDNDRNLYNNLDFDVATLFANARYSLPKNFTAFVGAEYNRYLSHDSNWNEFYTEFVPAWGLEKQINFGESSQLSLAYIGANHFSHSDPNPTTNVNDRIDSILLASWNYQFHPRFFFQPYYRFQYTHYWFSDDRNDFFNTFGIGLSWFFTDWASIRAFTSFEVRTSDDPLVQDYQKWDTGGGVNLTLRF